MSQKDYYAGWDFERYGTSTLYLSASVGGHGADPRIIIDGTYSHIALTSVTGTGTYVALAAALQTYFNGLGGGRPTYTITFNTTTMQYSFSVSSGTLALTFVGDDGIRMRHLLGFVADVPATSSPIVSTARPYLAISAVSSGPSNYSDEYEPGVGINEEEADDGTAYSISRTTLPVYLDWDQQFEEKAGPATAVSGGARTGGAPMFDYVATVAEMPCSWEYFYRHARCVEPFAVYDTATGKAVVCKLRAEGANFKPMRAKSDYDVLWNLPFKTRLLGRF